MTSLREHLADLVGRWDDIPIRAQQDGKWQSLNLSEINDGQQILDWIKSTEGRFWFSKEAAKVEEEAEQDALAGQAIAEQEAEAKAKAEYEHDEEEKFRHMEDEGYPEHEEGEA